MPAPATKRRELTVQVEGKDVEIELPEGYGTAEDFRESFDDSFAKEFGRRAKGLRTAALGEALDDEEFKTQALEKWGIDPKALEAAKSGAGKLDEQALKEHVNSARTEWERTKLTPMQKELEKLQTKYNSTLGRTLSAEVLAATHGSVQDYLVKAVDGAEPAIVSMFRNRFGYDEESGKWYVKKGDRFAVSAKPSDEQTYMGVSEYFSTLQGNKEYSDLFKDVRQKGADVKSTDKAATVVEGVVPSNDPLAFGRNAEKIASGAMTVA